MTNEVDDRCADCTEYVCYNAHLLEDHAWTVGVDGRRHWARKGEAVCGTKTWQSLAVPPDPEQGDARRNK